MTVLLRLFPRDWRDRYGSEVADLLAASARPWRDRVDLLLAAAHLQGERITAMRNLHIVAAVLVAIGIAGGLWATARLADGVTEIPQHWWSSAAILPAVAGIVLGAIAMRRRGHPRNSA